MNAFVTKSFRERTGPRSRFCGQDVRAGADGNAEMDDSAGGVGAVEQEQELALADCHHFIRLCRRLDRGGTAGNIKRMSEALQLDTSGRQQLVISRIDRKLTALKFETSPFIPTAAQMELPLEEFNALVESNEIDAEYSIEEIVSVLKNWLVSSSEPPAHAPNPPPPAANPPPPPPPPPGEVERATEAAPAQHDAASLAESTNLPRSAIGAGPGVHRRREGDAWISAAIASRPRMPTRARP